MFQVLWLEGTRSFKKKASVIGLQRESEKIVLMRLDRQVGSKPRQDLVDSIGHLHL